ncbi:MAG: tRNA epoxyqueuosine(34) reductase QueG [Myxococcaceae bacterium]
MKLVTQRLLELARAAGFDLAGVARAEPIPREVLVDWLAAGHHADLDWMAERVEERLDPAVLLPGAKTVLSLACNYWRTDEPSPIARYARGRDYHATMRDRLRALRRSVRAEFPGMEDYGAVDANPVMEKVWAVRAGLGTVTKNGCFTTPRFGSWVVLATMIFTAEADTCATPLDEDPCGRCRICLDACPTGALVSERVVDARACLSYQTIENDHRVPPALREALGGLSFGCDICQDVCPLNATPLLAGPRFEPRAVSRQPVRALAAMTKAEFDAWVPGTALARAGFDGLRRNAAYALGAVRDAGAREVLERLTTDSSERVRDAATWALARLDAAPVS